MKSSRIQLVTPMSKSQLKWDSSGLLPKYPERSSRSRKQKKEPEALAGAGLGQDKPKKPRKKNPLETNFALGRDFPADGLGGA